MTPNYRKPFFFTFLQISGGQFETFHDLGFVKRSKKLAMQFV